MAKQNANPCSIVLERSEAMDPWVHLDTVLSDDNKKRVASIIHINNRNVEQRLSLAGNEKRNFGSAVLVPFCTYRGKPSILYTIRSKNLHSHRNDVRSVIIFSI